MRTDKGYEPEKRTRIICVCNLFHRVIGRPPFHAQLGRKRASLRNIIHLAAFSHRLLSEIEGRMLSGQPQSIVVALAADQTVSFLAPQEHFVTEVLVPRIGVKLSDPKSPIT